MVETRHRGPSAGGPRTIGRFSPGDGDSVGLGPQQSTGYDVRVMSARHVGATLQIRVQVSLLGLGPCMAGMAVTSPVDVIRIPRSGGVVTFLDESFQQDC